MPESSSPFPHALFHSLHIEDAEGKTLADKFRRYILVVFVKDGNLFGVDEFKRIEVYICFFFLPGIALTFGVSRLVPLPGAAAWIFSAILSFVIWLVFKLKIKGFKKSFYFYIGLCVVVLAILIAIEVLTENLNVFSSIFALLSGAA